MTDIEIANSIEVKDIRKISKKIGLYDDALELYGKYKAKVSLESLDEINAKRTKRMCYGHHIKTMRALLPPIS